MSAVSEHAVDGGQAKTPRRRWRPGISGRILIGMGLGAVAGLMFGDLMAPLSVAGQVFIKFTQITVLPYIVLSLIHGVGSLKVGTAKRLATRGLPVILLFWAVILAVYLFVTVAFPVRTAATFYDPNRFPGAETSAFDWTAYIPSNPFASLADGMVPAAVIFSLCVGVALIGAARKEGFLEGVGFVNGLLGKVNRATIVYVSPFGIFAIVAGTVGTMAGDKFLGLSVYIATYVGAVAMLVVCALPLLTMVFTGLTYRQLFSALKAPLLLGFTTGSPFITLPLLSQSVKELLQARGGSKQESGELADTIIPVAYILPLTGKFAVFLFMPFAAWFAGVTLEPLQYVQLVTGGVLSLFGDMIMTVTFVLRQLGLPADSLNLFVATGPLVQNIYGVVEAATMAFFSVTAGAVVLGLGRLHLRRALVAGLVTLAVVVLGTAGLAVALRPLADTGATSYATLQRMQVVPSVPSHVYRSRAEAPAAPQAPAGADSLLAQVQRRGVLRVGYAPTAYPFSYFNGAHELVGFDVQRAYTLAGLLQCTSVDFIPADRQYFPTDLASGFVDIVVGAVQVTPDLYEKVDFTSIYLGLRVALVVPDARAGDYKTITKMDRLKGRRLAVEKGSYYVGLLRTIAPNFTIVELEDPLDFFKSDVADALFTTAEEGSAYTLMYPRFEVVAPDFDYPQMYLAYPVRKNEFEWTGYLNNWLIVEKDSGLQQAEYDYWVTGKTAVEKKPRWSIVRNVLHWVK